jgi:hypothetical protein
MPLCPCWKHPVAVPRKEQAGNIITNHLQGLQAGSITNNISKLSWKRESTFQGAMSDVRKDGNVFHS